LVICIFHLEHEEHRIARATKNFHRYFVEEKFNDIEKKFDVCKYRREAGECLTCSPSRMLALSSSSMAAFLGVLAPDDEGCSSLTMIHITTPLSSAWKKTPFSFALAENGRKKVLSLADV